MRFYLSHIDGYLLQKLFTIRKRMLSQQIEEEKCHLDDNKYRF